MGDRVEFEPDRNVRFSSGLEAEPPERVADILGPPAAIHLADPHKHVEVRIVAAMVQFDDRVPAHAKVGFQRCTGEAQHVGTPGQ